MHLLLLPDVMGQRPHKSKAMRLVNSDVGSMEIASWWALDLGLHCVVDRMFCRTSCWWPFTVGIDFSWHFATLASVSPGQPRQNPFRMALLQVEVVGQPALAWWNLTRDGTLVISQASFARCSGFVDFWSVGCMGNGT